MDRPLIWRRSWPASNWGDGIFGDSGVYPQAAVVTPQYPVEHLPHGGKLIEELRAEGYGDLREVPPDRLSKPQHQRMQRVVLNETAELDPAAGATLRSLSYPRFYIDFESILLRPIEK